MRWKIKNQINKTSSKDRLKQIQSVLLKNRGITKKEDIKNFLHPKNPLDISPKEVGINLTHLKNSLQRIKQAIKEEQQIIIFGDYDADGITATAILWETLNKLGAKVLPFIPHREKHGYGLSKVAINDLITSQKPQLIITVDNGIVAHDAAKYIKKLNIDLIITDHHVVSKTLPTALAIIQTTKLAGAGVAWIFSKEIIKFLSDENQISSLDTLDLATIGTIADQVSLTEYNRSIVKKGLNNLSQTKRVGLLELFSQADFDPSQINSYHINFIIAPRINAMGRLAHGLDSLRLLCTKNPKRAISLSKSLNTTNQSRKDLTFELLNMAKSMVEKPKDKLIIINHKDFHEGVIGLVAGKLTETHHRPSIVIGIGKDISKASARSISGVNVIELIRKAEHLLINAGGHPMAAGFSINTANIDAFKKELTDIANKNIEDKLLIPEISIECELKLSDISWKLFKLITQFEPFGMGNRKPIFAIRKVKIIEKYQIGKEKNHLKLILPSEVKNQTKIDALWFSHGQDKSKILNNMDLAFTIDKNVWNNITSLQLMIKDVGQPIDQTKNSQ